MKSILKRKSQVFFYVLFLIVFPVFAYGQTKTIIGIVSDKEGSTIPGATIMVVGTTQGTASDINGKFTIEVEKGKTLRISYIGFKTREIEISEQTSLDVILDLDAIGIEEVVAIGYGTIKKLMLPVLFQL